MQTTEQKHATTISLDFSEFNCQNDIDAIFPDLGNSRVDADLNFNFKF
jgi:hypothetical protein